MCNNLNVGTSIGTQMALLARTSALLAITAVIGLASEVRAAQQGGHTAMYISSDTSTIICGTDTAVVEHRKVLLQIDNIDDDSIAAILPTGCSLVSGYQPSGHAVISVDDTLDYCDYLDSLVTRAAVTKAIPNRLALLMAFPDDTYFPPTGNDSSLWQLRNRGTEDGSDWIKGADCKIAAAWDITEGDSDVVIALLDTGIPYSYDPVSHTGILNNPDLDDMLRLMLDTAMLWTHPNFTDGGCNGPATVPHGSWVASVAVAEVDNGYGVAGVNWRCKTSIMTTTTELDQIMEGIRRARAAADILNLSLGYSTPDLDLEKNVDSALADALLIVCSAGNGGTGSDVSVPARYASWGTLPGHGGGYRNVIAVGATTPRDSIADFSTRSGAFGRVSVCAPGTGIRAIMDCTNLPAFPDVIFWGVSGTSFSAPIVAGIASLILARYPGISPDSVRTLLESTADKLWKVPGKPARNDTVVSGINYRDSVWHPWYGYGRVNSYKALGGKLDTLNTQVWSDTVWASEVFIPAGDTVTIDSGAVVRVSRDDLRARGIDDDLAEITVAGVLRVLGKSSRKVPFQPAAEPDTPAWYGIRVKDGGRLTIRNATIANAKVGITVEDGGTIDTLIGVHFVNCETAIQIESDTLLLLKDVIITGSDSAAIRFPEGTEIRVLGSFEVEGNGTNKAILACTNDSTAAAWDGIHVTPSGSIAFSYVHIPNASTAILVDSGGVVDTPFVNCSISDCLVAFDMQYGVLKLRDVAMTGVHDYGIDASVGTATIRLQDSVAIVGIEDSSTAVTVSSGGKLVAAGTIVQNGYLGFEIRGSGADTVTGCKFTDLSWSGLFFREGDATDYSSGNVIEKDEAGSIEYGFLIVDQSVTSVGDTVRGGYVKDVYFSGDGYTFDTKGLYVDGKIGDEYGLFATGNSSTELVLDSARIDSFFATAHLYVHTGDVEILQSRFVTHTSSADASPYGVWDRSGTSGHVRCSDVLNQKTACVIRDDASCDLIWDGWGLHASAAGWNAIRTTHSGAFYVKNTATDSVDFRRNWWGDGAPGASRMSGKIKYGDHVTDSSRCGVGEMRLSTHEAREPVHLPVVFALEQNIPNPFNPSTEIRYALPMDQYATLTIYNVLGQVVRHLDLGLLPAGFGSVKWNGDDNAGHAVGSGMYFYRFASPAFTETKKMLLLR